MLGGKLELRAEADTGVSQASRRRESQAEGQGYKGFKVVNVLAPVKNLNSHVT